MGHKNKKNSKLNHRIKQYFDGDPFDVGVERVSAETLSEMFSTLGIYDIEHSKEVLVKAARMIWSEADAGYRSDILNFFARDNKFYKLDREKEPNLDRSEKIDAMLEELDASSEEAVLLHDAFMEVRSKKISVAKLESKLKHIRFEQKRMRLEKALDGIFDTDDTLEFNASLHYILYGQSFYKILTLSTKAYGDEYIQNNEDDELIAKISDDKEKIVKAKQDEINAFIKNLPQKHEYLTHKEIATALRASPPKAKTAYPLIKESVLESIMSTALDVIDMELHDEELLVRIDHNFLLPHSDINHNYILELHIELNGLLQDIWESKTLNFSAVIEDAQKHQEEDFLLALDDLVKECEHYATLLHLSDKELHKKVYVALLDRLGATLNLTPKIARKTVRTFVRDTHDEIIKKQRQALLARTIRDFKNLFPIARDMRRKLTLHIGPTNSGKTYSAMKRLEQADTGYYLAPLRLLALEGYEGLKAEGIEASLITGEEQLINEDATHISSTIEMLNFDVDVDVCVIDEVQMLDDRDRGWAWANAIIGAPAKEIIMTGSSNVKAAVIALAEYLGEELEIIEFERKNPLTLLEFPISSKDVEESTAIIAFSRKDVLRLKQDFSRFFSVSVVYGNLSPEVRREEARRFREGDTQILIATDAIAMGMNLPIKTILFSKAEKFDGITQRNLFPSEILQISGRAGRYGMKEEGFVGALDMDTLRIIKKNFFKEPREISIPFNVMANLEHIKLVSSILEENSLSEILKFFVENMEFNGPFRASNLDDMLEAALIVDGFDLDIATKYHLACAPLTLKSPYIVASFESYILALEKKLPVIYTPPFLVGSFAGTTDELLRAEDMVKEISLYLWLSYRFKDYFIDDEKARQARGVLNKYIEESLQQSHFVQRCRICTAPLPTNSKYSICQSCFKKNYTGGGYRRGKRN
ncbi:putative RNA helicase [Sulfurimonas gotlandica GD1]|uniref:Putative RNA helicase n=1 Tax=Sulfurimonas gotlandica (strain DSM 19862 / JCM 16533 / GD1) TaxID=929558 RepID=B6BH62_SULGG|nr:SUV3 C-terminal domain-containing protein [Sulfurimonas gotlandica]EDZ63733.1 Helicase conserved C-terminal domain protein [Sulfurimonas gotlandica GD1]EHP29851.1 putative RNA helicase [Sulfurimonas gotlandica GD1]